MTTPHQAETAGNGASFRVLLATDDSDSARCAEDWAGRLRSSEPKLVEIVCVARAGPTRYGWAAQTYRSSVRRALEQAGLTELLIAERTANAVGDRLQARGLRVHTWARQGEPIDELLAMIETDEPDLVTVGPRGRSALSELLLGSVSHQLVLHSVRPVLVTRPVREKTGELPASALVVLSGSKSDQQMLHWLAETGMLAGAQVTVLTILDEVAPGAPASLLELDARIREESAERERQLIEPLAESAAKVNHEVRAGHPFRESLAMADETGCDLLVTARPPVRRGRRALAEELAHEAGCSVLIVPTS